MKDPPDCFDSGVGGHEAEVPIVGKDFIESVEGERAEEDDCWRDWMQEDREEGPKGGAEGDGIEGEDAQP